MTAADGSRPSRRRLGLAAVGAVVVLLGLGIVLVRSSDDEGAASVAAAGAPATTSSVPPSTTTERTTTTAPPTTTTAPPTTTTALPGPPSMTLAFAGDLLPHLPLDAQAATYGRATGQPYDFHPMLDPMKPVIAGADLAICHMETPLAADQAHLSGYPAFGAPAQLIDAARDTGYDGCSTASNHSLDQGRAGIDATLARFDQDGMEHAGTARSPEEGAAITMYDVRGAKVAHLSYAYGFNGYRLPADAPFAANLIDVARIHADAKRAREAGAQLVVVSLHWGTEYQHEPDQFQKGTAAQLLPSPDIDVIIGHHAHVVQPIEQVAGTYVVWGMGNQLADQPAVPKSDGITVVLTAKQRLDGRYQVAGIEAVPTWIEPGTFRVLPIVRTLQDPAIPAGLRALLIASYDRTAAVLATRQTPGTTLQPKP